MTTTAQQEKPTTQTLIRTPKGADEPEPFVIKFKPLAPMDDEQFHRFCVLNDILRIERTAEDEIILMPPTYTGVGIRNANISGNLFIWAESDGSGVSLDSSTGFKLDNGAVRSPDASWIRLSRLESLTTEQRTGFYEICPDFVVELRSASDSITQLRVKMQEYMDNGALLGWLIDPISNPQRVYIYRPNAEVEILDAPAEASAEPELPGFTLNLSRIWATPP